MKKVFVLKLIYFVFVLMSIGVQGAVFTLKYAGTKHESISVYVGTWSETHTVQESKMYTIRKGEALRVDTGLGDIRYFVHKVGNLNGFIVNIKVGALNLGGTFIFYDDGKYSYYFGADSSWKWIEGVGLPAHYDDTILDWIYKKS